MYRYKLGKNRCPKCKSLNIYKRRKQLETRRCRRRLEGHDKNRKIYTCRSCKHEFDVPLQILQA